MDSPKYKAFLKSRLERLLKTHGRVYAFSRKGVNEFREPSDAVEQTIEVLGFLHQTQGYISKTATEGSQIRTEPVTVILMSNESAALLKTGDCLSIGKFKYKVTGFNTLNESETYSDVSLEVYDGWTD